MRHELDAFLGREAQGLSQQTQGIGTGCAIHAALQIADAPDREAGRRGERLLRQADGQTIVPEDAAKGVTGQRARGSDVRSAHTLPAHPVSENTALPRDAIIAQHNSGYHDPPAASTWAARWAKCRLIAWYR